MRLPAELPRTDIHHEPASTTCRCGCGLKRIGEDVSEKLDYLPGVFTVERHIRGKWVCEHCETLTQAPVPAQVIDKGIPTAGLLAQVLVAKFADHLPLYRQEGIFARAGLALPRSTLGEWVGVCGLRLQPLVDALKAEVLGKSVLHADETPVQMLKPGAGKTHRAYLWAYTPTSYDSLRAVLYDFAPSRAGEHCRTFLEDWRGKLVTDDYAGYKAGFAAGITELGCMAHARRKFHDLHANNQSQIAAEALELFGALYSVERDVAELPAEERRQIRLERAKPITETLHRWLSALHAEALSAEAEAAFTRECAAMGVDHVPIRNTTRMEKGKAKQQVKLDTSGGERVGEVLSEGEQRALALASFMAEVSLVEGHGAIIFDDPMSSLDHAHRERVARRLVQEASKRQVIVFTHDLPFALHLADEASVQKVEASAMSVRRVRQRAGLVFPELPFAGIKVNERLERIKKMATEADGALDAGEVERSENLVRTGYGRLRETWERGVANAPFVGAAREMRCLSVGATRSAYGARRRKRLLPLQPAEACLR